MNLSIKCDKFLIQFIRNYCRTQSLPPNALQSCYEVESRVVITRKAEILQKVFGSLYTVQYIKYINLIL